MVVTVKKLDELKLADKNIRRHTEKQLKEYVRSVNMFGQIRPLIVDEGGKILAGNGLYEALKRAGKETADCYVMKNLSENDKKKLMLADNRIFELGMTDADAFQDIIKDLDGDIDVPGWDEDLLETLNASMGDTLNEIESYGTFSQPDIQAIESKKTNEHQEQTEAPANYQPVNVTHKYDEAVNTEAIQREAQQEAEAPEADTRRFVICPHCGQKVYI